MTACLDTIEAYGLRAIGIGERLLPKSDITLCEQVVLIGSGLMWNVYFGILAVGFGFWFAILLSLGRESRRLPLRGLASGFVFLFRGSPLFIQFFFAYEAFVLLPKIGITLDFGIVTIDATTGWLTKAWAGALIVLFCNTAAYSSEIFSGALQAVPSGQIEAARACGMSRFQIFRRIIFPHMLRLAWPAYMNEAIFLFHSTTLVFFSGFPAWRQEGDALYYASYFAEKTFNPFIPYPIVAGYFIILTLLIIGVFTLTGHHLNRALPQAARTKPRFRLPVWR
jgi:polar amino acid transport system permease protein